MEQTLKLKDRSEVIPEVSVDINLNKPKHDRYTINQYNITDVTSHDKQ